MKHIALLASLLAITIIPTGAFAHDKSKDYNDNYQAALARIYADRVANGYTPDGRPTIPGGCAPDYRCAPRDYRDYRHDHDHDRGYRYRGW